MFQYSDHGSGPVAKFSARLLVLWVLLIALAMALGIRLVIEFASSAFVNANKALHAVQQLSDVGVRLAERKP